MLSNSHRSSGIEHLILQPDICVKQIKTNVWPGEMMAFKSLLSALGIVPLSFTVLIAG